MFKKIISSALIVTQFGLATGALAAPKADPSAALSPELKLLSGSIALSGASLSPSQIQANLQALFADYEKTAQPEGQTERMEQALTELSLYTPEQAHQLTLNAIALSSEAKGSDPAQASARFETAVAEFAAKYPPAGAQYSHCGLSWGIGIPGAVVGALGLMFAISGASNTYLSNEPDYSYMHAGLIMMGVGALAVAEAMIIYGHDQCGSED